MFLKTILGLRFSYNNTFLIINWLKYQQYKENYVDPFQSVHIMTFACTDNS